MEHGGFWHGTTLYDEQLHVPLFVKLPRGERAGTTRRALGGVGRHHAHLARAAASSRSRRRVQGVDLFRGKEQTFAEESHEGNVLKSTRVSEAGAPVEADQRQRRQSARTHGARAVPRRQRSQGAARPVAKRSSPCWRDASTTSRPQARQARTGALKAREVDVSMDQGRTGAPQGARLRQRVINNVLWAGQVRYKRARCSAKKPANRPLW